MTRPKYHYWYWDRYLVYFSRKCIFTIKLLCGQARRMKIVLNSLNLALPGLPFQWLYNFFFGGQQLKKHLHRIPSFDLNIGVLTRIWKSLYAQNYPRNSSELKIGLAHKSSAQECYESLFVEAYLPISRLTFSFLQNEGKLRRLECLTSIIATLISYCNPIK